MKRTLYVVAILFFWSSQAIASPFWCNGDDLFTNHPLSESSLNQHLSEFEYLPEKYRFLQDKFLSHVSTIDGGSETAIDKMVSDIQLLLTPESAVFLDHLRFRMRALFARAYRKADCDDTTPDALHEEDPNLAAVYAIADTIFIVGRKSAVVDLEKLSLQISERFSTTNSWLLSDGLAQWPWEMWVNGRLLDVGADKPTPKSQYIFLRPSLGLNLSYPRQEDADITPTGVVEVFGKIWYGDSYKKHWGISFLTDIDSEYGAGFGLALRWNGYWAGYVEHADDRPGAVYVGIDLSNILRSEKERKALASEFVNENIPSLRGLSSP